MSSDRESDADEGQILSGVVFWLEGPFAGHTVSKVKRLIVDNGGKVAQNLEQLPTHFLISPQLWAREKSPGSSRLLKNIKAANEENKTEDDPDNERCWILQPDWLFKSLENKEMLAEQEYDYEKIELVAKATNRKVAELERKRNGGKSRYAPGQRRKIHLEKSRAADLAREEAAMREEEQEREAQINLVKKIYGEERSSVEAGGSGVLGAQAGSGPSPNDARKAAAEAAFKRLSQSQEAAKQADDNEPDVFDTVKSKKVTGQHKPSSPKKLTSAADARVPKHNSTNSSGTKKINKRDHDGSASSSDPSRKKKSLF